MPENKGVMIAYASVYGNTECVANILACNLIERGIECVMHDVSVSEHSHIIADAFKYSHLVFASVTYNGGAFVNMENLLYDLRAHGLKNKSVALIENGSWCPMAARSMRCILSPLDLDFIGDTVSICSSLSTPEAIRSLADEIVKTL